MIPAAEVRAALENPALGLSYAATMAAVALVLWADTRGEAFPSAGSMAAALRVSRRTIQRGLRELEAAGVVTAVRGRSGGRTSTVWRIQPRQWVTPDGSQPRPGVTVGDDPTASRSHGWDPNRVPQSPQPRPGVTRRVHEESIDSPRTDATGAPATPSRAHTTDQRQSNLQGVHALREQLRGTG